MSSTNKTDRVTGVRTTKTLTRLPIVVAGAFLTKDLLVHHLKAYSTSSTESSRVNKKCHLRICNGYGIPDFICDTISGITDPRLASTFPYLVIDTVV